MDTGASDFACLILGSTEVLVIMDYAVIGRRGERIELEGAVGMHVAYMGHVVNVVSGSQVPAQDGMGGAARRAGQGHPHRAGEGHSLQGGVHKVQPSRDNILTVGCKGDRDRENPLEATSHYKSKFEKDHYSSFYFILNISILILTANKP